MSSNHPARQKAQPLGVRNANSPPRNEKPILLPSDLTTLSLVQKDAAARVVSILRMAGQAGEDPNTQIQNMFVILAAALNEAALILESENSK